MTVSARVLGGPMSESGARLTAPYHLRRWRAMLADAMFARVPVVVVGDSIVFGQGSDGVNAANNAPDNTQGFVGQLRSLFALSPFGGVQPGEGYLFNTDSRVTTTGAQTGSNAFSGPLRHSTRLLSGQTLSFTIPAGAGGTLQIVQANNSGDHCAAFNMVDLWGTPALAQGRGLQIASSVHPTRKGHGDMARSVFQAITAPMGESSLAA